MLQYGIEAGLVLQRGAVRGLQDVTVLEADRRRELGAGLAPVEALQTDPWIASLVRSEEAQQGPVGEYLVGGVCSDLPFDWVVAVAV